MFSSVHVRSADRGGAAGGGVRKESTLQLFQPRRKAALRLTVNPFGSDEPLPLSRHWHGDTGGDIVGSGLWFRVDVAAFPTFNYKAW